MKNKKALISKLKIGANLLAHYSHASARVLSTHSSGLEENQNISVKFALFSDFNSTFYLMTNKVTVKLKKM